MKIFKSKHINYFIRSLPNFCWPIKLFIIKLYLKKVGENFKFGYNSFFSDLGLIEIGNNVFMGLDTFISTNVPVIIEDNVMFGPRVTIIGGNHNFNKVGIQMRYVKTGGENLPIVIEDDAWIGANVTILKGVTIGEGCIIGAGSVVTKSMPPYSICFGNPCSPIKFRFNKDELKIHLDSVNSKYSIDQIFELFNYNEK